MSIWDMLSRFKKKTVEHPTNNNFKKAVEHPFRGAEVAGVVLSFSVLRFFFSFLYFRSS